MTWVYCIGYTVHSLSVFWDMMTIQYTHSILEQYTVMMTIQFMVYEIVIIFTFSNYWVLGSLWFRKSSNFLCWNWIYILKIDSESPWFQLSKNVSFVWKLLSSVTKSENGLLWCVNRYFFVKRNTFQYFDDKLLYRNYFERTHNFFFDTIPVTPKIQNPHIFSFPVI